MSSSVKTVIFDLDGTLYPMTKRFKPLFALFSFPHSLKLPKYMKLRDKYRGEEWSDAKELKATIYRDVEELLGVKSGEKWHDKVLYPAFFKAIKYSKPRSRLKELITTLKERGYQLVVLSDFGCVEERVEALGLDISLFSHLLSSEDLGGFKPNRRPFEELLKITGAEAESTLMVGDRDDTDGAGARKMGIEFIEVPGKSSIGWNDVVERLLKLPTL